MLTELSRVFAAVASAENVSVVVLTGAGRAFSAGVDVKALGDRSLEGELSATSSISRLAT